MLTCSIFWSPAPYLHLRAEIDLRRARDLQYSQVGGTSRLGRGATSLVVAFGLLMVLRGTVVEAVLDQLNGDLLA